MLYEKISLIKEDELKEYDLIKEIILEEYRSKYVAFTEDATKEDVNIYIMKVLDDNSLENIDGEELEACKKAL